MSLKSTLMLFILGLLLSSCSKEGQQISHAQFLSTHPYALGQTQLLLQDDLRSRPVKTEIWYPTLDTTGTNITAEYPFILPPTSFDAEIKKGSFPLVLISHGTGGNRISMMWLAAELAGNGYIVAAMDHFGNTYDNPIPENFVKVWDRPLDVSFVLDHLLKSPKWQSKIDTSQIAMIGFSLGGCTAALLAGGNIDYEALTTFAQTERGKIEFTTPEMGDLTELMSPKILVEGKAKSGLLKDKRIGKYVMLAPALGQAFPDTTSMKNITTPFFIIGATDDDRTAVDYNAKHYHRLMKDSRYTEVKSGHYVFLNQAKSFLKRNAPLIYTDDSGVDRESIHTEVSRQIIDYLRDH